MAIETVVCVILLRFRVFVCVRACNCSCVFVRVRVCSCVFVRVIVRVPCFVRVIAGMFDALITIAKEEGVLALYRGVGEASE